VVDTTADSGPGSLRQAIMDANTVTALASTIDFAIPGAGVQTIEPISPLPPITASVLIDGTTQPDFVGTPLIAIGGPSPGNLGSLAVAGANVTVRGVAIDGLEIDATAGELLIADMYDQGVTTGIALLDSQGRLLVEAQAVSSDDPDNVIDEYLSAGNYFLGVNSSGGQGTYTLTTTLTPSAPPFQPEPQNPVGSFPDAIVAADFTGDGRTDLAVANVDSNTVSVLLGNGDGTFQPQITYAVGFGPTAIVAGDFNGDGHTDLAVADRVGVQVLLGNGDGTFQPAETVAAGIDGAIVAGDFNGDGKLDLAVAEAGFSYRFYNPGGVFVLLGNGDGTFQPAKTVAAAGIDGAMVAGDFNGDAKLDLAVADSAGVQILLGNGDGTFQPAETVAAGIDGAMVAGDFNGDGRTDLAVYEESNSGYWPYTSTSEVSVLLSNGDGTFQPAKTFAVGPDVLSIVAGDFTGNGRIDLALAYVDGTVSVLPGNGDGTFQPQVTYAVGTQPDAIVTGDFTDDGHLDLAVANAVSSTVSVLLGNGDGTLSVPGQFVTTPHATPVLADLNGDGTDDVLVVDGSGNILYRQAIRGQPGTFEPPVTINPGHPSRDITWVAKTVDGPVIASVDAQDDAISLYAWRNGGFVRIGSLATGRLPAQIIAADLNGDGVDDLVVRNAGDGTLSVFAANSPMGPVDRRIDFPTFLSPVTLRVGLGVSDVQAVDTTGSGRLDLVVTNKLTGQVSILYNLADDTFAPPVPYRAGTGLSAVDPGSTPEVTSQEVTAGVAAGTFTTGGLTDLVTIDPGSNTLDVLAGLGGGRFANPVTIQTPSPAQDVRTGDFTGNGLDDLAVLTTSGLSIYLANGRGGFRPPTTYAVPSESDGLTIADFTGNGKPLGRRCIRRRAGAGGQRRRHLRALPRGQPGR
jgi:hypothetical protein